MLDLREVDQVAGAIAVGWGKTWNLPAMTHLAIFSLACVATHAF